jgi:dynein heavy chain, axonemal
VQVSKALPRVVENITDRVLPESPIAMSLARLAKKGEKGYFQLITENNDTPKQVTDIIKGVTKIVLKVQAVLNDMENKYKKIWDTDKDAYMRRYRKSHASRDFDADIKTYLDHIDEIRSEESTINLDFLHIDQQPIKVV